MTCIREEEDGHNDSYNDSYHICIHILIVDFNQRPIPRLVLIIIVRIIKRLRGTFGRIQWHVIPEPPDTCRVRMEYMACFWNVRRRSSTTPRAFMSLATDRSTPDTDTDVTAEVTACSWFAVPTISASDLSGFSCNPFCMYHCLTSRQQYTWRERTAHRMCCQRVWRDGAAYHLRTGCTVLCGWQRLNKKIMSGISLRTNC